MTRPAKYRSEVGKDLYKVNHEDTSDYKPPKWDEISDKEFSIRFPGTPEDSKMPWPRPKYLTGEWVIPEVKINANQQKEEINTMNTRRIVTVQLIDQDKGLPVANSVVAVFNNIVTEDTDQVTIQEVLMSENIAGALKSHNEVRQSTTNLDILNRTGNEVKLQPVKLKDLTWVVR